ncbi:radical SAM family heme chaperone HemW [Aquisalimonas lutea]|uniref:radical SAM family heme chaperone HemW n=1 Tax=Aquisalimonas lutea TaxID=1327750 RepID=UPI0025B2E04C|nr:radical SAM family heme chaperone HemW [Aquisalimonas lutea]MDN3516910.1 radical SAM family heme chaperone HemW [Aquisalimonas lutea]
MTAMQTPPLGLYVHLPWCVRKCPYCDFNSHAAPEQLPVETYLAALRADLDRELERAGGRTIASVFIGGGTPSLFPPEAVGRVLDWLAPHLEAGAEITLEANPGTLEQGRFAAFRSAGVNRLSIGVQSFDPARLEALGRIHGPDEARRAVEAAHAAGFTTFNVDLMFALPGQTPAAALQDVAEAVRLGAPHISHYQLTIEPNTVFYSHPPALPDEDTAWAMQQACDEHLRGQGLRRYEVSAWARPGHACRHNLNYWAFGDYLAIGAGAHGKISDAATGTIRRYRKVKVPALYMDRARNGRAEAEAWPLPVAERPLEFLMNALRLEQGFTPELFADRTGMDYTAVASGVAQAVADGLLEDADGRIRTTTTGHAHLDTLLQRFLPETS